MLCALQNSQIKNMLKTVQYGGTNLSHGNSAKLVRNKRNNTVHVLLLENNNFGLVMGLNFASGHINCPTIFNHLYRAEIFSVNIYPQQHRTNRSFSAVFQSAQSE